MPKIGESVRVVPAPQHVPANAALSRVLKRPGAFLLAEGELVIWSAFLEERQRHGELQVVACAVASNEPVPKVGALAPRELAPRESLEAGPPPAGVIDLGPVVPKAPKE